MKRFALIILASLLACNGSEPTLPSTAVIVEGTWILQSVNASPLPATNGAGTEILGSALVADDKSFTLTTVVRAAGSATAPETTVETGGIFCGHVGCSPRLLIVYASGANFDATVEGTTLTLTGADGVMVFRRQ